MAIQLQVDYAVARPADDDYSHTVFQCPTNDRQYESVRPVRQVGKHAVAAACYWCDTHRKVRGQDRAFDYDDPQWHTDRIADSR